MTLWEPRQRIRQARYDVELTEQLPLRRREPDFARVEWHLRFHARRGQISAVGMALDLIAQFLANPTQAPDSACIGEMEMNWAPPE